MNTIVRAWKDEAYRQSLSTEELAMLPANPAGEIELTDTELEAVSGGCNLHKEESISKIKQHIDQKAVASFNGSITLVNSTVTCSATVTATATSEAAATTTADFSTAHEEVIFRYWW